MITCRSAGTTAITVTHTWRTILWVLVCCVYLVFIQKSH